MSTSFLELSSVHRTGITSVHAINPLTDPRWPDLVNNHPRSSVFHTRAWLESLHQTYGYRPLAYTTSPDAKHLQSAMVFCEINSWLTGNRLVSLPFSDHCEPLVWDENELQEVTASLEQEFVKQRWNYIELRPVQPLLLRTSLQRTDLTYVFHLLDLSPDLDSLFRGFHKSSTARKIRRAHREGLTCRQGSSDDLIDVFYNLFRITRRRHHAPSQPKKWFQNLAVAFGNALQIHVALKGEQAVAAMLTIRHKDIIVYKYGATDPRFWNLGGIHLLFWKAIQAAKNSGIRIFDFGRAYTDQTGLITFKNRWGAAQSVLTYSRYASSADATHLFDLLGTPWKATAARALTRVNPRVLSAIGRVLYKHVG